MEKLRETTVAFTSENHKVVAVYSVHFQAAEAEPPGKVLDAECAVGEVTYSVSSAKFKNRIAGMLEVGKDIASHFKHMYSDLSTNALFEQQHEIKPTMKPRKLIQTSWKNEHQLVYCMIVAF